MSELQSTVVPHDPRWADQFLRLRTRISSALGNLIIGIEHVGSTSVPGLHAKPIIDMDAIYDDPGNLSAIIACLSNLGYEHLGNMGIEGREAFKAPACEIRHNFYVCLDGCVALQNHLLLRDHLRANPEDREKYGALKLSLAPLYLKSPELYVEGKTAFILGILGKYGMSIDVLAKIETANVAKKNRV